MADLKPFLRARRAIKHLWHITRGDKQFNPAGCDGCKEIQAFLTDPNFRGDKHYPVGVEIDPDWKLGPDEMDLRDCEVCDRVQPVIREANGDVLCSVCKFMFPD